MEPFTTLRSTAVPLLRDNIDTDAIIPSREMKTVGKSGLADGLFAGWRYLTIGSRDRDPGFVLNDPRYKGAKILLAGANFGCGSSREHAAWALGEYGFRAIIASSFNPIFRGNCVRNGIVPIEANAQDIAEHLASPSDDLLIDLAAQNVAAPSGRSWRFEIEEEAKSMLIGGLDAIDLTLTRKVQIDAFRTRDRQKRPWAYL